MQGLILAAGMGKRLKELTSDNTKCMVKVNGVTLIERMLGQLDKLNLSRVVIVVGYKKEKLIDYIKTLHIKTPICFVENPIYDRTNNIYSLALAKKYLVQEDTILLESDLIFEDSILEDLVVDSRKTLALVDKYESWMDGTCVKLHEDDTIEAFVPGKRFRFEEIKDYYKTVNIYKFGKEFSETHYVPFLEAYSHALGNNEYYEQVLRVITMLDEPGIVAKRLNGQSWYEIDDLQDLDIAESIFNPDSDQKIERLQKRYGGYWRYPKLTDFCYLVNPYFPPQKLMDEIKANFETLLVQYPSGMRVNTLLAAKSFNIHQANIAIGNGAAELICVLMQELQGKTGFVCPTFQEYLNRYGDSVVYEPETEGFAYTAADIMKYFTDKEVSNLVLVNPDNPSGNYIGRAEMQELFTWAEERHIKLIVDESFVDFADEEDATLLNQAILEKYYNLIVVKSISKSYGVPGLRLGILASGNEELIGKIKVAVPIWNINSFAEFYMQIIEKYQNDYKKALSQFRMERSRMYRELKKIQGIIVYPSQANYIMIQLQNGQQASELTKTLLMKYNLFIKDLTGKIEKGQYVRLAIRNEADNNKLIYALRNEISGS